MSSISKNNSIIIDNSTDKSLNKLENQIIDLLERYKLYITIFIMFILILLFYIVYSFYSFIKKKMNPQHKSHISSSLSNHIIFQIISILTIMIGFYIGLLSLYKTILKEMKEINQLKFIP